MGRREGTCGIPQGAGQKDGASGVSGASAARNIIISQLTERQLHIIKFIAENPLLSVKKLAQVAQVPYRTFQRDLAALQKQGIIIRDGNTSAKKWIVSDNVSDIPTEE